MTKHFSLRRILAAFAALALLLSVAACNARTAVPQDKTVPVSQADTTEPTAPAEPVNIAALSGPTGIGMAKLASDGGYNVSFVGAPDEIVGLITTGEVDIACVPTNLAATLYAKTNGDIRVCAVTTLGVLYLLDASGEVSSIADLVGKSIGATGQGSNPEYILNYILEKNGLTPGEDVKIDYAAEHAELASLMVAGDVKTAILPVPFATQVQMKVEGVNVIDLQAEWAKISDAQLAQGVVITTARYADEHSAELDSFLDDLAASSEFAVSSPAETAALVEKLGVLPSADLAEKAIPSCNIVCMTGDGMKNAVGDFLSVLYEADPKSVGGALPDDDIFYIKK